MADCDGFEKLEQFEPETFLKKQSEDKIGLKRYLSDEELTELGSYEKFRLENIMKNYEVLTHLGMKPPKPEFMLTRREKNALERKRQAESKEKDDDSDEEWRPPVKRSKSDANSKKIKPTFLMPTQCKKKKFTSTVPSDDESHKKKLTVKRYPTRSTVRPCNYMLLEIPDDDQFLYCEECNFEYASDCPTHGPLTVVTDAEVDAKCDEVNALQTLPSFLRVKQSSIPNAGLGVFTNMKIEPRTRFGPYKGNFIKEGGDGHSSGYSWQINDGDKHHHYVDALDPSTSNWMRYVNCARTEDEQNLHAFQHCGNIYYRSYKTIPPNKELLVFYGASYAKELGIDRQPLTSIGTAFSCDHCHLSFSEDKYLQMHRRRRHALYSHSPVTDGKTAKLNIEGGSAPCNCTQDCDSKCSQSNHLQSHMRTHKGERPYKCTQCDYSCSHSSSLQRHMRTHTGERPYKCTQCDYSCSRSGSLQCHMRTHTGERPYKCTQCDYSCSHYGNLQRHIRTHTGERPYKCTQCDYSCSRSGSLQCHMRTHTGERPYKCTQCDYSCSRSGSLQCHMRTHTGERPYKCTQCDYSCSRSGSLQCHMRTHTGERPYKCTQCDYSCSHYGNLQRHIRTHTGERPYKCTQCDYSCSRSGSLQCHMRTHTGERPYKCTQCDYSCSLSGSLQCHMRTHTGERPYKCTQCDYSCSLSGHLQSHMRTHTGERPYKCTQCSYSCSQSSSLQSHTRTHTGERPYKCTQCDYSCSQSGHLQEHMRTHTGERPYKCTQCDYSCSRSSNLQNHIRRLHCSPSNVAALKAKNHNTVNEE